jgi:hypothetical protein
LVFVFAGQREWDRRHHARIVENGMRSIWTWELEGRGKMLGVRVRRFFVHGREGLRRNEGRLVERVLICDDGSVLGNGSGLLGSLSLVGFRAFLLGLFNEGDLRLLRAGYLFLGDDREFLHGNRHSP